MEIETEELTPQQRRRGFEIADAIAVFKADPPDEFSREILAKTVDALRKHFGYSEAEKEARVFERISLGASTVNDLIRETGFARWDVWKILNRLEERHLIYLQKLSYSGNGRPLRLFFVAETEKSDVLRPKKLSQSKYR